MNTLKQTEIELCNLRKFKRKRKKKIIMEIMNLQKLIKHRRWNTWNNITSNKQLITIFLNFSFSFENIFAKSNFLFAFTFSCIYKRKKNKTQNKKTILKYSVRKFVIRFFQSNSITNCYIEWIQLSFST
jgi:hypothetical protein